MGMPLARVLAMRGHFVLGDAAILPWRGLGVYDNVRAARITGYATGDRKNVNDNNDVERREAGDSHTANII